MRTRSDRQSPWEARHDVPCPRDWGGRSIVVHTCSSLDVELRPKMRCVTVVWLSSSSGTAATLNRLVWVLDFVVDERKSSEQPNTLTFSHYLPYFDTLPVGIEVMWCVKESLL